MRKIHGKPAFVVIELYNLWINMALSVGQTPGKPRNAYPTHHIVHL